MKIKEDKAWVAILDGDKLPRKVKNAVFGKKKTKKQLREMILNLVFADDESLVSDGFCPKCGCTEHIGYGNEDEYPCHYEKFYCPRCEAQVGLIDNSRFIHILEGFEL